MKKLILMLGCLSMSLSACATTGPTPVSSAATSGLAVARSGVDATAHAFDAALYGLDVAMEFHLLTPGSTQAKQIAAIGRQVQKALNQADNALTAGNSAAAKAALDMADGLISQFRSLLPAAHVTGMLTPSMAPAIRAQLLARAAA